MNSSKFSVFGVKMFVLDNNKVSREAKTVLPKNERIVKWKTKIAKTNARAENATRACIVT